MKNSFLLVSLFIIYFQNGNSQDLPDNGWNNESLYCLRSTSCIDAYMKMTSDLKTVKYRECLSNCEGGSIECGYDCWADFLLENENTLENDNVSELYKCIALCLFE